MDFAQARMYSNPHGRFTTSDPLLSSGELETPQSWNKYSYSLNNPTIYTDPAGLYVCDRKTTQKECQQFEAALQKARDDLKKIEALYGKGKIYQKAERALSVYGKAGEKNGVIVMSKEGLGSGRTSVSGVTVTKTKENPNGQEILVGFDKESFSDDGFSHAILHEGSHVADGSDWVKSGFKNQPTDFQLEYDGYYLNSVYAESEGAYSMKMPTTVEWGYKGPKRTFTIDTTIWSKGWEKADVETLRKNNIEFFLRNDRLYRLKPDSKDPAFFKGARAPR